jgi:hypothetical protein
MQYRQGQATAAMYKGMAQGLEVQAQFTRFNAKQESLKHRKKAADELDRTLMFLARINAAAGAGHMDPLTGNPFGLRIRALDVGGTNFAFAKSNEAITVLMGEHQAKMQEYQAARARLAGKTAKRMATISAVLTLAGGAYSYSQTAIPATAPTTAPTAPAGMGTAPTSFGMNVPSSMGGVPGGGAYFGTGYNYPSTNIGGTQIFRI